MMTQHALEIISYKVSEKLHFWAMLKPLFHFLLMYLLEYMQ